MAKLTTKARKAIPGGEFALPGRRYPIEDRSHAANALSRVSQFGSSEEKARVRSAVRSKYLGMGEEEHAGQHEGEMTVRPLNDRILVKRLPLPEQDGLIIAPEIGREPSFRGKVVSVGPGKRGKHAQRIPCDVLPGDVVLFGKYTDFDRDDLVMIQEGDIRYIEQEATMTLALMTFLCVF